MHTYCPLFSTLPTVKTHTELELTAQQVMFFQGKFPFGMKMNNPYALGYQAVPHSTATRLLQALAAIGQPSF